MRAADCEKAWLHPEWKDTVQQWYHSLHKDEEKRREEEHQKLVSRILTSAEGGGRFTAQDHETNSLERRFASAGRVGGSRCTPMRRREGKKRKEWAKHWQCDSEAQGTEDRPWRNEQLRNFEEGLSRLREDSLENAARSYTDNTGCEL